MSQHFVPLIPFGEFVGKLPYDIKEMVYEAVFQYTPTGKTPALLVALRASKEMYKEALRIFYRATIVNLGREKGCYQLRKLKTATLVFVTRLEVSFRGNSTRVSPNLAATVHVKIRSMENLQDLKLDFSLASQQFVPNYPRVVRQWLIHFKRIQKITLMPNLSPIASPAVTSSDGLEVSRPSPHAIDTICRALRVPGRLANIIGLNNSHVKTPWDQPGYPGERNYIIFRVYKSWRPSRSFVFHEMWFWEAEEGKTLAWQ